MNHKFTCTMLLLPLCALLSSQAIAQNHAVAFDGTDSLTMDADLLPSINTPNPVTNLYNPFTIEAWVYTPTLPANSNQHTFLSQGQSGEAAFLGYDGVYGKIIGGDFWYPTNAKMPLDQWVHLALTLDANRNARLYVNGVQKDSLMGGGYLYNSGLSNFVLGTYVDGTENFIGNLDEVRVWNYDRSAAQIKAGMFGNYSLNSPGLVAAYQMNEGTGSTESNASTSADRTNVTGQLKGPGWVASPVQVGNNGVQFDGVDDQVIIPANTAYDLSGPSTLEFYMIPGTLSGDATILTSTDTITGDTRYRIHMTQTSIGLESNGSDANVSYTFTPGTPYQVAFASDGSTTTVYVNGIAVSGVGNPLSTTFNGAFSGKPLTLGLKRSGGTNTTPFNGLLDEIRIWNIQRIASDINAYQSSTLTGQESGLVGLFSFDQGTNDQDNTGLITAVDNTVSTNNATLTNFALTNASLSNFSQDNLIPIPLPVIMTQFTAVKQGTQAMLQWQTAQEENSKDFTVERSTDGKTFTSIGTEPAAGTSHIAHNYYFIDIAPQAGTNYYRLKQSDLDGKFVYSDIKTVFFGSTTQLTWYTSGKLSATINLKGGNNAFYSINDVAGNLLRQGKLSSGTTTLSGLSAGMYIVSVVLNTGETLSTQVIVR